MLMGEFTYEARQHKIFIDEVPMGDKTYRTYPLGVKTLQILLPRGRETNRVKTTCQMALEKR